MVKRTIFHSCCPAYGYLKYTFLHFETNQSSFTLKGYFFVVITMIIHVQILICGVSVCVERQLQMLVVSAPKNFWVTRQKSVCVCVTEIRNHHQLIIIVNFDTPFPLLEENNSHQCAQW